MKKNLETEILYQTTGKCIAEGILKPNSVRIINYSSGSIRGNKVEFQVVFECMVCHPVEGMLMNCVAKTITKAGIHAEVIDEDGSVPVTVFIARDHHFTNTKFANVTENEKILVNDLKYKSSSLHQLINGFDTAKTLRGCLVFKCFLYISIKLFIANLELLSYSRYNLNSKNLFLVCTEPTQ